MPYQQVSQCKFYISTTDWLQSLGIGSDSYSNLGYSPDVNFYGLNPSSPSTVQYVDVGQGTPAAILKYVYNTSLTIPYNYFAILGHRLATDSGSYYSGGSQGDLKFYIGDPWGDHSSVNTNNISGQLNWNTNNNLATGYDGFSIVDFNEISMEHEEILLYIESLTSDIQIGRIIAGRSYTMPHSPDLSLKLSYDYSGIKTIETKGGASLSNAFYTKPPMWGDTLGAWELDDGHGINQALSRSGRKIYDLSFSFLDDGDIFGSNQSLAKTTMATQIADGTPPASDFDSDDLADDNTFNDNVLTGDNFYSQVINKTRGLPFIFQPDVNDNTNFIIAKFDQKAFSFQQTAPGLYSTKCRIVETW